MDSPDGQAAMCTRLPGSLEYLAAEARCNRVDCAFPVLRVALVGHHIDVFADAPHLGVQQNLRGGPAREDEWKLSVGKLCNVFQGEHRFLGELRVHSLSQSPQALCCESRV